jgi:cation transport protein ChaC
LARQDSGHGTGHEALSRKRNASDERLWIFGYGSLVWRPAFPHLRACPASITGYARRFWQGSTDHRGLPGRPGRVVTLIPDHHAALFGGSSAGRDRQQLQQLQQLRQHREPCWGTAYEIRSEDPDEVLAALDHRERGGYERVRLEIELHEGPPSPGDDGRESIRSVTGLVYIAGPENDNFLGEAPIDAIARQIMSAAGPSGPNPEYVFALADRLRRMGADDEHVFEVEAELLRLMP